jgi:hypothetical protein
MNRRTLTSVSISISAALAACAVVGASTNITQFPPSDHAVGDLGAAAVKVGCQSEATSLDSRPAVRVTCAEGSVTFFREQGTVRVQMGDKIIAECGDTPRPKCDIVVNRVMATAQGAPPPATTPAAPPPTSPPASSSAAPASS